MSKKTFAGNIDKYRDGKLSGWVFNSEEQSKRYNVGLFVGGQLVGSAMADGYRDDLKNKSIGDGRYAFAIPLGESHVALVREMGGEGVVRLLNEGPFEVGRYKFSDDWFSGREKRLPELRGLLFGDLMRLSKARSSVRKSKPDRRDDAVRPSYLKLFEPGAAPGAGENAGSPKQVLSPYLDYVRYRSKVDKHFDVDVNPDQVGHFLSWYLGYYASVRSPKKIPLGRREIDYLNEKVLIGGQKFSLTRATWAELVKHHDRLAGLDLNNHIYFTNIAYWWAIRQASSLNAADCLVPQYYVNALSVLTHRSHDFTFPLNAFLERYYTENTQLHMLDVHDADDRTIFMCALLLKTLERPDFLRYVPPLSLRRLLEAGDGEVSLFSRFLRLVTGQNDTAVSEAEFKLLVQDAGYDMDSGSFLFLTREGHRAEAVRLGRPDGERVDLQLIGPFEKASGLGQATRLSGEIAALLDLTTNHVDHGLDNPAPEGFSRVAALSAYKKAKVNLIHLNAESIPLAFAYEPDIFTGAYNIGYFFWELNSPAACHFLALELLDEVWVASDYGVRIYKPAANIPVTNVGMCFEPLPPSDRAAARAFVERRARLEGGEFVFLVAFDSFSFVQRKNPLGVLRAFALAFPNKENVRLIIKTQNRDKVLDPTQQLIWDQVDHLVAADSRIAVLNETLDYLDLVKLKQGSDCYVSLHKSEGWGFGMVEAMNLRVPVVCTGYSANLEFCSAETAWLVDHKEVLLEPHDYIFVTPGQKWAEPDIGSAAGQMRDVWADAAGREMKVEAAYRNVQANFSAQAIARRYGARLKEIFASLP